MSGKGLGLGKGFAKKTQEEKPQINENMLLEDVDNEVAADIKAIYDGCLSVSSFGPIENADAHRSEIKKIKERTKNCIFGELMSVAHQIDNGKSTIKGLSKELDVSHVDIQNSSHARTTPTPFIKRSVERIIRHARDISADLDASQSKMEAAQITDPLEAISAMLKSQHSAVIRCSSKVASVRSNYESLRAAMQQKLPASSIAKIEEGKVNEQNETCSEEISSSYKRFVTERKNKFSKRMEKMDMFGAINEPVKPATGAFGKGALGANTMKKSFSSSTTKGTSTNAGTSTNTNSKA